MTALSLQSNSVWTVKTKKSPLPPLRPQIAAFCNTEVGCFIRGCLMVNNAGLNTLLLQRVQKDIKNSLSCIMLHLLCPTFFVKTLHPDFDPLCLRTVNMFFRGSKDEMLLHLCLNKQFYGYFH